MEEKDLTPQEAQPEAAADVEPQPAPEGEGVTGEQPEPTPDPFADIPFDKVRERYAADWEREAAERERKAKTDAQSESRKEFAAWRRKYEGELADHGTFSRLEALRASDDPDHHDAFRQEMARPDVAASYARGQQLAKAAVSNEDIEKAKWDGEIAGYQNMYAAVSELPQFKVLADGKLEEIRTKADSPQAFLANAAAAAVEVAVAKATEKLRGEEKEALRQEVIADLRAKGLGPEDLETTGASTGLPSKKDLDRMTLTQIRQLEREGKLDKILAGGK
jgi:hypothetical protein